MLFYKTNHYYPPLFELYWVWQRTDCVTLIILRQSTGAAASIAIDEKVAVQDVPYTILGKVLIDHAQILKIPENWAQLILAAN